MLARSTLVSMSSGRETAVSRKTISSVASRPGGQCAASVRRLRGSSAPTTSAAGSGHWLMNAR